VELRKVRGERKEEEGNGKERIKENGLGCNKDRDIFEKGGD
jgi:hypothetical protein